MRFSTAGIKKISTKKLVEFFKINGIHCLEISNFPYQDQPIDSFSSLLNKEFNIIFHNYFMQEKHEENFVMNLASLDEATSKKTIKKIKHAINLSSKLNSKYFAFHAGFFLNLNQLELGRTFSSEVYDKEQRRNSEDLFFKRLESIAAFAKQKNIEIGVETNVCTKANLEAFEGVNPFMLASDEQVHAFAERKPKNVGILWDFGHVKVSSRTFGFCPKEIYYKSKKNINGLHFSDNDGEEDQNEPVVAGHWTLNELTNFENTTFEVYGEEHILKQIDELKISGVLIE